MAGARQRAGLEHGTNGWLAEEYRRPAELIEAFHAAEPEFVPVLLRQRDHARHHQPDRQALFDGLLDRIAGQGA